MKVALWMTWPVVAVSLGLGWSAGPEARASGEAVAEVASLQLHSAFWPNLHHLLYAAAWSLRAGQSGAPPLAGALPSPLEADLTPAERSVWGGAIAYYDHTLASRDLLRDGGMIAVNDALASAGDMLPEAGLTEEHRRVLTSAAAVYRVHWWPEHDRANRAWIEQAAERLRSLSPEVPDRLASLYRTPWFTTPVRVDVVWVGNRQGAYTTLRPTHITISSGDPDNRGWTAAEILFHESSHALVGPISTAFRDELAAQHKRAPVLWHVALFYLTGEVMRQALAARALEYSPYLYQTGLFDRAWPQFRPIIEREWAPYVAGRRDLEEAVRAVVRGIE
jgi:hypothetical protein